jgi:pimeloyl-ACP methyl ester carboxylesterase
MRGPNEVLLRKGRGAPSPRVHTAKDLRESSSHADHLVRIASFDQTVPDALLHEPVDALAGVIVQNIDAGLLTGAQLTATLDGDAVTTDLPSIPAFAFLKVPVRIQGPAATQAMPRTVHLSLQSANGDLLATGRFELRTRSRDQAYKRTFKSKIDGSVQYYAIREATPGDDAPGIVLSLHGASVEATGQAQCFANRDWCHVVAPTNRRPFGFDWEEWGRLDAMEALHDARSRYVNDEDKTWLTGHSMGGHGTWNVGLTLPDQWAAIAPSAGWATFWSYTGPDRYPMDDGVREILRRAANPSDTMLVLPNASRFGVYILHGDADTVVPIREARDMRAAIAGFHGDFSYFEEPGAGHWWGDQCMDFPSLMQFLSTHQRSTGGDRNALTFVTVDPSASATCDWVTVQQQRASLVPSRVDLRIVRSDSGVRIEGTTENIAALSIDPAHPDLDATGQVAIALDGHDAVMIEASNTDMYVHRDTKGAWHSSSAPIASTKNPTRAGRLRTAWNNNVVLVYGTTGTPEERRWSQSRARQDAERWWYRGNGLVEIVSDVDFDPDANPDQGVIVYGNRDVNAAWSTLLVDAPIQVNSVAVLVDGKTLRGDDLAALFVRPRPGSDTASVAVVAGTGIIGQRLTATFPLFLAGVGWPDWFIARADVLTSGEEAIEGVGFFGADWSIDPGQSRWN